MKRDDSVFFFTLVDFLLTTTFFALVVYAISTHRTKARESKTAQQTLANISKAAGVSSLTELTDELTRLGPIHDALETADVVKQSGGIAEVARTAQLVQSVGGYDSVSSALARLRKQDGYGLPPCLFGVDKSGRRVLTDIGAVQANDSEITFVSHTPVLDTLLSELHLSFDQVRLLKFGTFRDKLSPLRTLRPTCLYSIRFEELTRFVDARDAAQSAFRLDRVTR